MERDHYFDNYKAFLIILVVVGHFIHPLQETVPWTEYLRKVIFIFHMPAFIFISGYFAKRNDWVKLLKKLFIPYLIMQVFIWVLREASGLPNRDFTLIQPYFTLWFLPCLFFWRLAINKLSGVKGILPISFVAGILAGFNGDIEEVFSLSRLICFFPYFLLGYWFEKERFVKYAKTGRVKALAAAGIAVVFLLLAFINPMVGMDDFLFRGGYLAGKKAAGAGVRILLYAGGTLLTYLFAVLMPVGRHWFSSLGTRTMSVYLFHGILVQFFENSSLVKWFESNAGGISLIAISVVLTFLLALKPFSQLAAGLGSVPVERLIEGGERWLERQLEPEKPEEYFATPVISDRSINFQKYVRQQM